MSPRWCLSHATIIAAITTIMLLSSAATSQPKFPNKETYHFGPFSESHPNKTFAVIPAAMILSPYLLLNAPYSDISGRVLLKKPFKLWEDYPNGTLVASFTTSFLLEVASIFGDSPGEGLAFLISPSLSIPPLSYGQYLGLTNELTDGNATNQMVAIELDTVKQDFDPDDNHIGLNINSVKSNVSVPLSQFGYQIAPTNDSPNCYVVWVKYDGKKKVIDVYMAAQQEPNDPITKKPTKPVLSRGLDIRGLVNQVSYFGFSASTGEHGQLNYILKWNLSVEVLPKSNSTEGKSNPTEGQHQHGKNKKKIAIGVGAPLLVLLLVGITGFVYYHRKKITVSASDSKLLSTLKRLPATPREFRFQELKKATNNFDDKHKLGQGGFGVVYKGILPKEKLEVAVKKFLRDSVKSIDDFLAELTIINRLRHKNLVRLLGT